MTRRAVGLVEHIAGCCSRGSDALYQSQHPSHLVGVYVEQTGLRIKPGASPFGSAVVARKYYGSLCARGIELAVAAELVEAFQRCVVSFRGALRKQFFGEPLSSKWRRR